MCAAVFLAGCTPRVPEIRTVNLGEKVQAGSLSYSAFDTQWLVSIGEGSNARLPSNRFLLVHLNVVNGGRGDITVPTLMLMDDEGVTYNEIGDGRGVPNWMGIVRKIRPGEADNGNIAFDVAPKHYKLRVGDESEERFAYIDIPLSFTGENPDLPKPLSRDGLPQNAKP